MLAHVVVSEPADPLPLYRLEQIVARYGVDRIRSTLVTFWPVTSAGGITSLMNEVTRILSAMEQGAPHAAEQLLLLVYDELRRLAAEKLAQERPGQTLQATALVHEAYVRLVDVKKAQRWNSRGHFFAAAAEAMRRILVENARRKQRVKHGGGRQRIDLNEACPIVEPPSEDLLALDEALTRLVARDPVRAELVKLRFFAGLTMPEAARALGLSLATTERHWTFVRTWLYAELTGGEAQPFR